MIRDAYGLAGIIPVSKQTYEAYWEAREEIAWQRPRWEGMSVDWVTWLNARILLRRLRTGKDVIV